MEKNQSLLSELRIDATEQWDSSRFQINDSIPEAVDGAEAGVCEVLGLKVEGWLKSSTGMCSGILKNKNCKCCKPTELALEFSFVCLPERW